MYELGVPSKVGKSFEIIDPQKLILVNSVLSTERRHGSSSGLNSTVRLNSGRRTIEPIS